MQFMTNKKNESLQCSLNRANFFKNHVDIVITELNNGKKTNLIPIWMVL